MRSADLSHESNAAGQQLIVREQIQWRPIRECFGGSSAMTTANGVPQEEFDSVLAGCREEVETVRADLLSLKDSGGAASPSFVHRVLQSFQSVNQSAGRLHYQPLEQLSNLSKQVMEQVESGKIVLPPHLAILLSVSESMKTMITGELRPDVQFSAELASLNAILHQPQAPVSDANAKRGLRVLVVEDDFSSRLLLQGLISKYGECHTALNGKEALDAFSAARQAGKAYDLICMDIHMPEMDGHQAVSHIRAAELKDRGRLPAVKILMTSSSKDVQTILASYEAKCDGYLIKPFDGKKLEERLKALELT